MCPEVIDAPPLAWSDLGELAALLPPRKIVGSTGSIDRYGFLHVLARRCGMRAPLRAFAEWVHGWVWDDSPTVESLAFSSLPRDLRLVVRNHVELEALKRGGFQHVVVGGLPFAYVSPQHRSRNANALLAIPPHSAEIEKLTSHQFDYLDYLESIKIDYEGVYVSIFHLDWEGPMHVAAVERGLNVVQGARPDDANSLARMRALFEAFDQVTSNTMGSHFIYALGSGCRVSFCGPQFVYDESILLGNGNPNGHTLERAARLVAIQAPSYLRQRFGRFFVDHPRFGTADSQLANAELGRASLLDIEEIKYVLGWNVTGQIEGYAKGAWRRLQRGSFAG